MSEQTIIGSAILNASLQDVWACVSRGNCLAQICRSALGIRLLTEQPSQSGRFKEPSSVFVARFHSYEIVMTAKGCTIRLLFTAEGGLCCAAVSASADESAFTHPTKAQLEDLFDQIRMLLLLQAEAELDTVTPFVAQPDSVEDEPAQPADSPLPLKKRKYPLFIAAVALLLAAILGSSFLLIPDFWNPNPSENEAQKGYSLDVTPQNAMTITLGDSRIDIERRLGTAGAAARDGFGDRRVYRGGNLNSLGLPTIQLCVTYRDDRAAMITYLDLDAADHLADRYPSETELSAGMAIGEIAGQIGRPIAMMRRYTGNGGEIVELHFGFTDPFANFDPAWRGEWIVTVDHAQQTVTQAFRPQLDGFDPLLVNQFGDRALAGQFTQYNDYLNDWYQDSYALQMRRQLDYEAAVGAFGALTYYDTAAGVYLYACDSAERLPGTTDPLYIMTFGYDSKGIFQMYAYVNMRLAALEGTLAASHPENITRRMSYNEVRAIAGILPAALFVDKTTYTLGYGRRLDGARLENQFELVVVFDLSSHLALSVFDNTH